MAAPRFCAGTRRSAPVPNRRSEGRGRNARASSADACRPYIVCWRNSLQLWEGGPHARTYLVSWFGRPKTCDRCSLSGRGDAVGGRRQVAAKGPGGRGQTPLESGQGGREAGPAARGPIPVSGLRAGVVHDGRREGPGTPRGAGGSTSQVA